MTETTDSAVLASGLEPQYPQGLGNNDALLLVVGSGNTLEGLQALHSGLTAGSLVRNHTTDGSPEHLGGSAEVEGTWSMNQHTCRGRSRIRVLTANAQCMDRKTYHREWGCNGSACAGKQSTSLYNPVSCRLSRNISRERSAKEQALCILSTTSSPCSPILSIALQGLLLVSLARSVGVRTLGAEELAGDVEGLASHNNDLLAVEELLGDGAGEATEQVALAVDDLRALSARRSMEECVLLTELEAGIAAECEGQYWAYRVASIGAYVQ